MVNFVNVFYHNKVIQENIPEIEDLNLLNESSVLKKINSGWLTPRHILKKLLDCKDKNSSVLPGKKKNLKGNLYRILNL